MEKDHVSALKRAIAIAGNQIELAQGMRKFFANNPPPHGKGVRVRQQTISYWLSNEVFIGAEYWPAIESVTDGRVTRRDLRPDVFSRDHAA